MLQELLIKDFAIIEDLRLEFGPGLNLITGETGAGKSIIIDALQTLLGAKSSPENVRDGSKESVLEGTFLIPPAFPLREKYLALHYINENDQEIIVRRIISATGKSKSYLNGNMINQAALAELSDLLLEIHGQNQQISLFKKSVQLSLLDSYAGLEETVFEFERLFYDWTRTASSLRKLKESEEKEKEKRSFLKFQVEELESAGLNPDEEIRLEEERRLLVKSEFLKAKSENAYYLLSENEENSVLSSLQTIQKEISEISVIDSRGMPLLQKPKRLSGEY
ncbi:MAG: AAA family ATPase [Nitrospirae bacterium]|nr:AAA family ATPase [Nitrospirota bacterium]